jgi:uncharacterized phiE125 gp8 family phage protein
MALTRTADPAALLSLADAKEHLRVSHSDEDDYISALIPVVTDILDGNTGEVGKALVTQTWTWTGERPVGDFELPVQPVQSVTSIKYYDADNVQQTLTVSDYLLDDGVLTPKRGVSWPQPYDRGDAYEIVFVAGYGVPADVPAGIIHAAKLILAHYYETREDALDMPKTEIPRSASHLIARHKSGWIAA